MHLDLPIHPRTGLRAVGIVAGRPVWPILGGSSEPPADPPAPSPDPPTPDPTPTPPGSPNGYPADTPVADMTASEQAAYWRAQARKHERVAKNRQDYDQLKADSVELVRLRQQTETDTQRATREAADAARAEVRSEMADRLVMAEIRAAAGGRISAERLDTLVEDLDLRRFLDDSGEVDLERVAAKVAAWAPDPTPPTEPTTTRPRPDPTQGARGGAKTSGTAAGREMYAARRRRPAGAQTGT